MGALTAARGSLIQRCIHVEAGQEQAVSKRVKSGQEEHDGMLMVLTRP
jgi:hypothetical protein